MLDWKASRELRNKLTILRNSFYIQNSFYCIALFAIIVCECFPAAGGGTFIQRSVPNRIPVANFLALYKKLRIEQLSLDISAKFYSNLYLPPRRLSGGWNDDSDDHVISLTGAEDRLNSRPNAATPHQQIPNQQGVQDITEKVLHKPFPLLKQSSQLRASTPCAAAATVAPGAVTAKAHRYTPPLCAPRRPLSARARGA